MSIRLEKPWLPLDQAHVSRLRGELGVFQIADAAGELIFIGYAGGRSLFGLRGELEAWLRHSGDKALRFRVEVTSQYLSRFEELLMIHKADLGEPPRENLAERTRKIGRLSPG
jgi:hypothetical protein